MPNKQDTLFSRNIYVLVALCVCVTGLAALWIWGGDLYSINAIQITRLVERFGDAGPLLIVIFMALAIVISPLPSAPIALTAGAIYGHTWGTIYVVAGAELGALFAFMLARWFARDMVYRLLDGRIRYNHLNSQNLLTAAVFASRLVPFISFDLVSYAAGLTRITTLRFALATLAGILPASFLLAHFGDELTSLDTRRVEFGLLAVGLLVVISLLVHLRRRSGVADTREDAQQS